MPTVERVIGNAWQAGTDTTKKWINLSRLLTSDSVWCGCENIASKAGTRSKPSVLYGNSAGFNIHQNSRIDRIYSYIRTYVRNPTGGYTGLLKIPFVDFYLIYANGGSNSGTKRYNASVPSNPAYLYQTWSLSEIPYCTPAIVNSPSFGACVNPGRNTSSNVGDMHIDYISLKVDYTDPTYSLSATLTPSQVVGGNVTYTLTLNNTNSVHQGYAIPVSISIPSGLTVVSQSGNGTYSNGTWNAILVGNTATLTLTLNTTTAGNKTITSTVNFTGTNISKTTNIQSPNYTLNSTLPEFADDGSSFTYTLNLATNTNIITTKNVAIPLPQGVSYSNQTGDGTYNPGTGVWAAEFTAQEATISLTFTATTVGSKTFTATVDGGTPVDTATIIVLETNVTVPFSRDYLVPEDVLDYLVDGEEYTYSWYAMVEDTVLSEIYEGEKNFKIGLFQDTTETLSNRPTLLDTWTRCSVQFTHDSTKVLKLRLYGQYLEISPETSKVTFTAFMLTHGDDIIWTETGTLFTDPENLLLNGDYSTATLPPLTATLPFRFSNNFAGMETDSELIVKGIGVSFDYICSGELGVLCTIDTGDGDEHYKSTVLPAGNGTCTLGGDGEYWGIPGNEGLTSQPSFLLEFLNTNNSTNDIQVKNVQFLLYTQYDQTEGATGFTYNGVHSRVHNINLTDNDNPVGADPKLLTLNLQGSDGAFVTGQDFQAKTLTINFALRVETLEEGYTQLQEIGEWLRNERDNAGIPIPKELVFDYTPDLTYLAILDDMIAVDLNYPFIKCKATFTIPSGVAYKEVVDSSVGTNNGLTRAKPTITAVVTDTGEYPEVIESVSGQSLTILDDTIPIGTVLTINVEERTITGNDNVDYTPDVSLDSRWPTIAGGGDFDFRTSTNILVTTVVFQEGY